VARLARLERVPVAAAILFVAQLALLQIGRGSYFRELADSNRIDTFAIPAARGAILDSRLRALAYDAPGYSVMYIGSPEHPVTSACSPRRYPRRSSRGCGNGRVNCPA
jgi:cell division protein FtsI/penicillin-binding protein 2